MCFKIIEDLSKDLYYSGWEIGCSAFVLKVWKYCCYGFMLGVIGNHKRIEYETTMRV